MNKPHEMSTSVLVLLKFAITNFEIKDISNCLFNLYVSHILKLFQHCFHGWRSNLYGDGRNSQHRCSVSSQSKSLLPSRCSEISTEVQQTHLRHPTSNRPGFVTDSYCLQLVEHGDQCYHSSGPYGQVEGLESSTLKSKSHQRHPARNLPSLPSVRAIKKEDIFTCSKPFCSMLLSILVNICRRRVELRCYIQLFIGIINTNSKLPSARVRICCAYMHIETYTAKIKRKMGHVRFSSHEAKPNLGMNV